MRLSAEHMSGLVIHKWFIQLGQLVRCPRGKPRLHSSEEPIEPGVSPRVRTSSCRCMIQS